VDDIAEIVDLGSLYGLLGHEVVWHHSDILLLELISDIGKLLHSSEILSNDLAHDVGKSVFAEVNALMARTATNITHENSSTVEIILGHLEILKRDLSIPDAALANALSGHEGLTSLSILWVVLAPLEDRHIGLIGQVEWRRFCGVLVRGIGQEFRDRVVSSRHG
jgi:hypothetical protein